MAANDQTTRNWEERVSKHNIDEEAHGDGRATKAVIQPKENPMPSTHLGDNEFGTFANDSPLESQPDLDPNPRRRIVSRDASKFNSKRNTSVARQRYKAPLALFGAGEGVGPLWADVRDGELHARIDLRLVQGLGFRV